MEVDIDTGTLPRGLTLDSQRGLVSGTPLQLVRRTVRIRVTDSSERKIDGKPQDFIKDIKITVEPSE